MIQVNKRGLKERTEKKKDLIYFTISKPVEELIKMNCIVK